MLPRPMRVISGEFGGRRLVAPGGSGTRPTSDRVREALFMSLEPLAGLRVVDLYAGSGALAVEALSRGAVFADLVDDDRGARQAIERNLEALALSARARGWLLRLPAGVWRLCGEELRAGRVVFRPPCAWEWAGAGPCAV